MRIEVGAKRYPLSDACRDLRDLALWPCKFVAVCGMWCALGLPMVGLPKLDGSPLRGNHENRRQ